MPGSKYSINRSIPVTHLPAAPGPLTPSVFSQASIPESMKQTRVAVLSFQKASSQVQRPTSRRLGTEPVLLTGSLLTPAVGQVLLVVERPQVDLILEDMITS